jgi:hypothetical protein
MPKAVANIALVSAFHNLSAADLADEHGTLGVRIAELQNRQKAIAGELIRRGEAHIDGALFRATLIAETMTATVDRKAIEGAMGEAWLARFLKWSHRSASVRTAPIAAAVARLAA